MLNNDIKRVLHKLATMWGAKLLGICRENRRERRVMINKKKVENIDYLKYLYSTDIFYLHVFLQVIHREKHFEAFGTLEHLPLIFARPAGHKSRNNFTGVL